MIALPNAHGPKDVKAITHEAFVQWFDEETAGPIERYVNVGSQIWSLWQRHQGQAGLSAQ